MSLKEVLNVGIYKRLSKDDKDYKNESSSLVNQEKIIRDYVKKKGWRAKEVYMDDGVSGTTFDRPDFKRMIKDLEDGFINCVIVKDLSRFGRNYVQVGHYMEEYFPERNIRFIAIHDNIDTFDEYNDMAPFQNLFNEFYPKDVSKKVRAVKYSGFQKGDFMNSKPAYGYAKSLLDKHQLIIDEEAAEVVKRIFNMYAAGYTGRCIAETLTKEGIANPRTYHYNKIGMPNPYTNDIGSWNSVTITAMLRNQVYIGNMVQGKRKTVSFKSKKIRQIDPEQWVVVNGTHDSIIESDVWDNVQSRLVSGHKARTKTVIQNGLFSGIIRCADCGSSMALNVKSRANGTKHIYKCSRYANHGKTACSAHYTTETEIEQVILSDIKHYALLASDKEKLVKKLTESASMSQNKELHKQQAKLAEAEKRLSQIDDKIKILFEEKVSGGISGNTFNNLMNGYEKEREAVEKMALQLGKEIAIQETKTQDASKWVTLIRKNIDINKLDRETVFELIELITISETYEVNGQAHQTIKIKYKFVGCLSPDKEESIANAI